MEIPDNHRTRWVILPPLTPLARQNLSAFPPILRQILYNRGFATDAEARAYLRAEVLFDTSPWLLTGMEAAVKRLEQALEAREGIVVYGDYDVDGVTATAILTDVLRRLGGRVRPYIPNRFEEGYGLNAEALETLASEGAQLVVSVDCGIRSYLEARRARALGLDLIITDHHEPSSLIPEAFAVINPKQPGDRYPEKDLAGVGIAYKLVQALSERFAGRFEPDEYLDLVALGTVADLAPLVGENRSLVRRGLQQLAQTRWQGLFSLANLAGISLKNVTATHIAFMLGPRLNAAGRLESALDALHLLLTQDVFQAGQLAQKLEIQNRERQALTRKIQQEAEQLALAEEPDAPLLFAVHPEFNAGVVGLAAARLVEMYYRPAVIGQRGEKTTRCSCRSIPEFNITAALDRCADLLMQHGGHAAAAGFTVRNDNLDALSVRLKTIAREQLAGLDLRPTLTADMEVQLADLHPDLLKYLRYLQPTGYGNPEAVFVTRGVQVKAVRVVGSENKHLKLVVSDGRLTFDAIGFRLGHLADRLAGQVDILYTFELNEYNGRSSLQLNLKDVKPSGLPD
ncbi:MAG: single-stranded-DNA-specific exonuclease RecJ [Anaerolineales bacterium]|nr:single-stranded-DNA-specific exonuclease RecJ [Anaerolineales bacterium]